MAGQKRPAAGAATVRRRTGSRPAKNGAAPVRKAAAQPRKPRRKRRRRRSRQTLNVLFFGVVGTLLFGLLCYFVFFRVYRIQPTGNLRQYTKEQIIDACGIAMQESLFDVTQEAVYAALTSKLPYVHDVEVRKRFPTTVELKVIVSEPAGAIQYENHYLYIDSDGKILENNLEEKDPSVPLILGIAASTTQAGNYVLNQNSEQIVMLKLLVEAIQANGVENVSLISVANRLNMRIMIDNRYLVELGTESDLEFKLAYVLSAIKKQDSLNPASKGVIDATMATRHWVIYRDEADLDKILEEDRQMTIGMEDSAGKNRIRVDPRTGEILVGLTDPLNPDLPSGKGLPEEEITEDEKKLGEDEPGDENENGESSSEESSGESSGTGSSEEPESASSSSSSEDRPASESDSSSSSQQEENSSKVPDRSSSASGNSSSSVSEPDQRSSSADSSSLPQSRNSQSPTGGGPVIV